MADRIFKNTFLVSFLTLVITLLLIVFLMYDYSEEQIQSELQEEARLVSYGVTVGKTEYLANFSNRFSDEDSSHYGANKRITWIDSSGKVLYDSYTDADYLENHMDRQEIKEAFKYGSGKSQRQSDTVSERLFYYALRLDDGTVLRLSARYASIFPVMIGILQPLALLILLVIIFSYLVSLRSAKKIVGPINEMDLENGYIREEYDELLPLVKRIRSQNILIENQIHELKRTREEFTAITNYMKEGLVVVDNDKRVLLYNASALDILDIQPEILQKDSNVLVLSRNANFRATVDTALAGKRSEKLMEIGEKIYRMYANPVYLRGDTNHITGAVILLLDETEKEHREVLRREFTSNVSHELKTPLTAISGMAEIMANGIVKSDDVADFSKNIYEEAQRLLGLINDIIFLSKLDEGSLQRQKTRVDLKEVVKNVKSRMEVALAQKNITMDITGNGGCVEGIPSMLDELVYNLCDNACKYNKEDGKITVDISTEDEPEGDVIAEHDITKKKIILTVSDTGIGIPADSIGRIFERFYRVDKSHSKAIGGTGLGLSIVKHVAMCHNARIDVTSKLNEGTAVRVEF